MSILGIGTDIVATKRIAQFIESHPERFPERVLHEAELKRYHVHTKPAAYLAKRFAAKEAVAKAIGTGIGKFVQLNDIQTVSNSLGKPDIIFHNDTLHYMQKRGVKAVHLSLSDEVDYAIAYVILVGVTE